jgi:hypothetical protein
MTLSIEILHSEIGDPSTRNAAYGGSSREHEYDDDDCIAESDTITVTKKLYVNQINEINDRT